MNDVFLQLEGISSLAGIVLERPLTRLSFDSASIQEAAFIKPLSLTIS